MDLSFSDFDGASLTAHDGRFGKSVKATVHSPERLEIAFRRHGEKGTNWLQLEGRNEEDVRFDLTVFHPPLDAFERFAREAPDDVRAALLRGLGVEPAPCPHGTEPEEPCVECYEQSPEGAAALDASRKHADALLEHHEGGADG